MGDFEMILFNSIDLAKLIGLNLWTLSFRPVKLKTMPVSFDYDFPKTLASIAYLASKEIPELTKYKLCKLLFLADKLHLVRYGRVITGDRYCAIKYGPIPSRTLDLLTDVIAGRMWTEETRALGSALELDRHYENARLKATDFDATQLSQSDVMALDKVVADYGHMGFGELKAITHSMYAYKSAWTSRPEGTHAAEMDFEEFFEEDSDAVVGAREQMHEDDSLRKIFPAGQQLQSR